MSREEGVRDAEPDQGDAAPVNAGRPALRLIDEGLPLLIAGADRGQRAALHDQLALRMPEGTRFRELSCLAEVLEEASLARMVIISGRLSDISARSMMRILGQRHPTLPVVSLDPTTAEHS